jgi:hypothetical protein
MPAQLIWQQFFASNHMPANAGFYQQFPVSDKVFINTAFC